MCNGGMLNSIATLIRGRVLHKCYSDSFIADRPRATLQSTQSSDFFNESLFAAATAAAQQQLLPLLPTGLKRSFSPPPPSLPSSLRTDPAFSLSLSLSLSHRKDGGPSHVALA